MREIALVYPNDMWEADAADYLREHRESGEKLLYGSSGLAEAESYGVWLGKIAEDLTGGIQSIQYFVVRAADRRLLGTVNIRHPYEGYVRVYGHIGYALRKSERGKGYAPEMLRLALARCRALGLEKALLTCFPENIASAKTILRCGGVFEGEAPLTDSETLARYWIRTTGFPIE